jgi:polyhydroxyalkanoate synthase
MSNPASVLTTPIKLPNPVEAGRALNDVAVNVQDAARAMTGRLSRGAGPLPYDPLAIGKAFSEFGLSLMTQPGRIMEAQAKGLRDWTALWTTMADKAAGKDVQPVAEPARGDRRFSNPAWNEELPFDCLKQAYLLASRQVQDFVGQNDNIDSQTKAQVDFFTRQWLNAASPSNFALTNPEVIRKTAETGGLNLLNGLAYLFADFAKGEGLVQRRAKQEFELGKTIAATPGQVIYQNELMQLIQYDPTTEQVYKRPLLFIPPLVNKYYLFDLQPRSSYLKWLVDQGHTVFVISWVNPTEDHAHKDIAAYIKEGALEALDAIEQATGERQVDIASYCLGGTLTAATLAYLAASGQGDRVGSATLIATLIDFSDLGEWSVFLGDEQFAAFERYLADKGYVESHDLAKLFSVVRSNDLIWSSVVNHYLLGEEVAPSDMLWWFADGARIPAAALNFYGRAMLQQNKLREPGGVVIDGVPLDLGQVKTPVFFVSLKDDHVSGWQATYEGTKLFGGPVRFLVGGSGHNAGTINPPAANKHGYWTNAELPEAAEAWMEGAVKQPGSWWPEWQAWAAEQGGNEKVPAREVGAGALKPIEPAPGSYVRVRH